MKKNISTVIMSTLSALIILISSTIEGDSKIWCRYKCKENRKFETKEFEDIEYDSNRNNCPDGRDYRVCNAHGGIKQVLDETESYLAAEETRRARENTERQARMELARISAEKDRRAAPETIAAATEEGSPAPITNHSCGTHSVACSIKEANCIFNVDGTIKTVLKTAKGVILSPKYKNDNGSYGCMARKSFDALP